LGTGVTGFLGLSPNVFQLIRIAFLFAAAAICLSENTVWCWAVGFSAKQDGIGISRSPNGVDHGGRR
jgi:Na+-transporting NADH:ubiquinone oxidoreductase subunit NqrB